MEIKIILERSIGKNNITSTIFEIISLLYMHQSKPLFFPNGDRFDGAFLNATTPLQGTFSYSNGDQYIGSFSNSMRHGHGKYTYFATK